MGVTLTDPNILVNLPHFLGKGADQSFFQQNRNLNASIFCKFETAFSK